MYTFHVNKPKVVYHGSQHATRRGWSVTAATAGTFYAWVPHEMVATMKNDGWIVSTKTHNADTAVIHHSVLESLLEHQSNSF